jgi:hypothetical protein
MFKIKMNGLLPVFLIFLGLVLGSTGCTARSPESLLAMHNIGSPVVDRLDVCVSYACRHFETTFIDPGEWEEVMEMMRPDDYDSPEHERWRVSKTIGLLERIIGPKVGTQHNRGRNEEGPQGTRQLDCIADMVNTTIYLKLLSRENLMRYHEVAAPARKGPLNLSYWHYTAVIEEIGTKELFAIDPWFHDNGHQASVLPLDNWKSGDYRVAGED